MDFIGAFDKARNVSRGLDVWPPFECVGLFCADAVAGPWTDKQKKASTKTKHENAGMRSHQCANMTGWTKHNLPELASQSDLV